MALGDRQQGPPSVWQAEQRNRCHYIAQRREGGVIALHVPSSQWGPREEEGGATPEGNLGGGGGEDRSGDRGVEGGTASRTGGRMGRPLQET